MELNELQRNWDELGKEDPLWAILTHPERKGGKWDTEEFFESGREEIETVMGKAGELGFPVRRDAALDFGCGVGRLTQALCEWFGQCRGVDIAPSMIEQARRYNRHGDKCEYVLNPNEDLRVFADNSFDLVYSNIVLQHMQPKYSGSYIREFLRVLRPGGLVVFQIPDHFVDTPAGPVGPPAEAPMPDGGFRAGFVDHPTSFRGVAGQKTKVQVTVENLGDCTWPSAGDSEGRYAVQLGNHWLTPEGETVDWDDGRQPIPYDIAPQVRVQIAVAVTPPAPGKYVLEFDMVQEWASWFKHKSSSPALVPAEIEPEPAVPRAVEEAAPHMEMYGVEKDTVLEILIAGGATILDILPDNSAGPQWVGFQYFATKS